MNQSKPIRQETPMKKIAGKALESIQKAKLSIRVHIVKDWGR
jgi:hypothetical protein